MGSPSIFQENAIDSVMVYQWTKENGNFKLVYRPVDYSAFQDVRWLIDKGIMLSRLFPKPLCKTLSGMIKTPQGSLVVWNNSTVEQVFYPTHLSIAVKLYIRNILFEYVDYSTDYGMYGLFHTTQLLYRHYVEQ